MSAEPAAAPAQRRSPISRARLDLGAEVLLPARTVSGSVRSGRRTEVDYITGALVREGQLRGVQVPLQTALYRLVKAREAAYS